MGGYGNHPGRAPAYVAAHLATLKTALDQLPAQGGVPIKDGQGLLIATWNLREFGRFTAKWTSAESDTPKRDLRSLLFIATILERFDVIALQELQGYTDALQQLLTWLNRERAARWRVVVSDVVLGEAGDEERLGYLFDSSRLDLDGLVGEIVIPPEEIGVSESRLDRQFAVAFVWEPGWTSKLELAQTVAASSRRPSSLRLRSALRRGWTCPSLPCP